MAGVSPPANIYLHDAGVSTDGAAELLATVFDSRAEILGELGLTREGPGSTETLSDLLILLSRG